MARCRRASAWCCPTCRCTVTPRTGRGTPTRREWLTEVIAGFCAEVGGPRAAVVGHDFGAELALRAIIDGGYTPARLVLMANRLHRAAPFGGRRALWRLVTGSARCPAPTWRCRTRPRRSSGRASASV